MNKQEIKEACAKLNKELTFHDLFIELGIEGVSMYEHEWTGFCPIHDKERKEKRSFAASDNRKLFVCKACNENGNLVEFVKLYLNEGLMETINWLQAFLDRKKGIQAELVLTQTHLMNLFDMLARKTPEERQEISKKIARMILSA